MADKALYRESNGLFEREGTQDHTLQVGAAEPVEPVPGRDEGVAPPSQVLGGAEAEAQHEQPGRRFAIPEASLRQFLSSRYPQLDFIVCSLVGSHSYGFPSRDSDYDLKAIHLLPADELLGLEPGDHVVFGFIPSCGRCPSCSLRRCCPRWA